MGTYLVCVDMGMGMSIGVARHLKTPLRRKSPASTHHYPTITHTSHQLQRHPLFSLLVPVSKTDIPPSQMRKVDGIDLSHHHHQKKKRKGRTNGID